MWGWFLDNAVWILVVTSVLALLLLLFNGIIRRVLSAESSKGKHHHRLHAVVDVCFWTFEGITAIIMITAFVAMSITTDLISATDVQEWFGTHGVSILLILIVGIVFWIVARKTVPVLISKIISKPQKGESRGGVKRRAETLKSVILGLIRVIIILLVAFMILSELTVEIGPILAGFGVVGIAVGFGAQFLIRDLIAGMFILMENQYRVGDVAKVADVIGSVEEINLRKTVLRDLDGIVHHVPNGEIRVASNYSRGFARVNLDISVSYDTDLNYAIGIINEVCEKMAQDDAWKGVFRTTPKVLRVNNLGDSGIDIKVLGEVEPLEQWRVTGELRLRIKNEFDRVGIEIPWPHTKVFFGNKPGD